MPKSRGRRRKQEAKKQPITPPKPPPPSPPSASSRIVGVFLAVATLIGVPAAIVAFWPRMTLSPSPLFDDSNAYSETFAATNIGFLPFEDVSLGVGICKIQTERNDFNVSPQNCEGDTGHIMLGAPFWETPELKRDEVFSIVLSDVLDIPTDKYRRAHPNVIGGFQMVSPLKAANVIVSARFKPWPFWWYITRNARFVAEEQPNGKMMWREVPLSFQDIKLPE